MLLWTSVHNSLYEHMFSLLLGTYLGMILLGYMGTLVLTFWATVKLFPKVATPVYIVISSVWGLVFPHYKLLLLSVFFDSSHSSGLLLFSLSVMSNCLWPHGLQHARLPCPSPSPGVSSLCPFSWWCHPTILSSVVPFSSCLQSFPASWSSPVSWLFASCGQSIGASGSATILPMNIQG